MEGILYNYKHISHDLAKKQFGEYEQNPKMDTTLKKRQLRQQMMFVEKNDDAILRMTAGRSRWQ